MNFQLQIKKKQLSQNQAKAQSASKIKVAARFKPISEKEIDVIEYEDEQTIEVMHENVQLNFQLDKIFTPYSTQEEVFQYIGQNLVQDIFEGYNGTIFAYGQTGSGKTYTMMGTDIFNETQKGIIPRVSSEIFKLIESQFLDIEYTIKCSMVEIYKESIRDLLSLHKFDLKIKETPWNGVYVENLTWVYVVCEEEILEVLELGERQRTIGKTLLNEQSSRSHTIFNLEITQKFQEDIEKKGIMHLVDLAGSEKLGKTKATGETLEEAKKINLSLSALGNVIHALASNNEHVPYRDSKLTRLLSESLGGNFKTSLIATCNPTSKNLEETISTLKFAQRAKIVKNSVKLNIKTQNPQNQLVSQLRKQLNFANEQIQKMQIQLKLDLQKSQSASSLMDLSTNTKAQQKVCKQLQGKKQTHQYAIKQVNLASTQRRQISLGSVIKDSDSPLFNKMFSLTPQGSPKQNNILNTKQELKKVISKDFSLERIDSPYFFETDNQDTLMLQIQTKDQTIKKQQIDNSFLQNKLKEYETQIERLHKSNVILEIQNQKLNEKLLNAQSLLIQETNNRKQQELKNEMLQNHIEQLTEALENCDGEYFKLLNTNFFNFLDQSQLSILEFLEKLSFESNFNIQAFKFFKNQQVVTEVQQIMQKTKYGQDLIKSLEKISNLNEDSEKFFLRSGLYNSQFVNLQLKRAISALE